LIVVVGSISIGDPFPVVPRDVIESVSIGRKLRNGRDSREPVRARIFVRELSLMDVGHPLAVLLEFVSPGAAVLGPTLQVLRRAANERTVPGADGHAADVCITGQIEDA
jgi:hypothetical protein